MMMLTTFIGCQVDDTKLQIYDNDALILEEADSYTYSVRTENNANVANQFDLTFRGFTGKETIFTLNVNRTTSIDIDYLSDVSSGHFKVVITTPDSKVFTILTGSDEDNETLSLGEGTYLIKLVGKTAFGTVSMTLSNINDIRIIKSAWE